MFQSSTIIIFDSLQFDFFHKSCHQNLKNISQIFQILHESSLRYQNKAHCLKNVINVGISVRLVGNVEFSSLKIMKLAAWCSRQMFKLKISDFNFIIQVYYQDEYI